MDINDFRSILTLLGFLCFLGICAWAYSNSAKRGFDEAAQLPFTDDDLPVRDASDRQPKEG
ncbi:MAG: cbb3-type cytochrome c oxidase subunit 3 [Rhodocyclaceae bacterium]|nr:cbb3-type cytochrome c oxidase subunit 3 [Rhodocyclaceae bacterium]